jgi:YggT family protein
MSLLIAAVATLLLLFQILLLARAALDWTAVLAGPSAPQSVRDRLSTAVRRVTEPVLAPVRRVLPPLRLGRVVLDTAFIAVFLGVLLLRQVLLGLGG